MGELMFVGTKDLRSISIDEESSDADLRPNGSLSDVQPLAASQDAEPPMEAGTASSADEEDPKSPFQPVPKPRNFKNALVQQPLPDVPPSPRQLTPPTTVPSSSADPSLSLHTYAEVRPSKSTSESLGQESCPPVAKGPLPSIPPPPPLPVKLSCSFGKARTRAFHWDEVSSDKVAHHLKSKPHHCQKALEHRLSAVKLKRV